MPTLTPGELSRMRVSHIETLFAMSADVERLDVSDPDPYGNTTGNWQPHLIDEPCWFDPTATQGTTRPVEGPNVNVLVSVRRLKFKAGTDIRTDDRITRVIGADGSQVAGQLKIHEVRKYVAGSVVFAEEIE